MRADPDPGRDLRLQPDADRDRSRYLSLGTGPSPANRSSLVAFVGSADLDRSHAFYGDVLGLKRTESSSFANAYDANGTQLRVTRVDEPVRAPYTVLGWRVEDASAEIERLESHGVEAKRYPNLEQDTSGVWTAPSGSRIAWFEDPDGNVLSFQQAM